MYDRFVLCREIQRGRSLRSIARDLGRSASSLSRELKRHRLGSDSLWVYNPRLSDAAAKKNASARRRGKSKLACNDRLRAHVFRKLKLHWSPEQVSMSLKKTNPDNSRMNVSHEAIYTYIYLLPRGELRRELLRYLRHRKAHRGRRDRKNGAQPISDMISIDERPPEVANRTVPGHWEGDLIVGKGNQSALGTMVERTTRTVILVPLKGKDAESVRKMFAREIKRLPQQMALSLTYDRGSEMAQHKLLTKDTRVQVYFAHPRCPWERGTCENTNMLVRDFFPKGTDFSNVSRHEIKRVQKLLNERPRKTLNWETPKEAFAKVVALNP
jgi:IS30 family transposase